MSARDCPQWCDAHDRPDHWQHIGAVWQTLHEHHYGREVMVCVPEERSGSSAKDYIGRAEVLIEHAEAYYPEDAERLTNRLQAATSFARRIDEILAGLAAQGAIETNASSASKDD